VVSAGWILQSRIVTNEIQSVSPHFLSCRAS